MSKSEHREHESEVCDGGNGEEDDEEDKEREDGGDEDNGEVEAKVDERLDVRNQRKGVFGMSRDFRNAIKRPFRKTRRRRKEKEKERGDGEIIRFPSAGRRGRRSESGGVGGCYICFMRPRAEESPETPTSDPNSQTFSFEMLRALIESNDFYCKECNSHI